jgi:hypothetical protein
MPDTRHIPSPFRVRRALTASAALFAAVVLSAAICAQAHGQDKSVESLTQAYFDAGWQHADRLRWREYGRAKEFLKTIETSVDEKAISDEDWLDVQMMRGRLQGLIEWFDAAELARTDPSAYLPRHDAADRPLRGKDLTHQQRFEALAAELDAIAADLKKGIEELKTTADKNTVVSALKDCDESSNALNQDLAIIERHCPEDFEGISRSCNGARRAFLAYRRHLEKILKDVKPLPEDQRLARKRLEYQFLLKYFLHVDMTPEQVLDKAMAVYSDTERELDALAKSLDPSIGNWHGLDEELMNDHPAAKDIVGTYRDEMLRAIKFVKDKDLVTVADYALNVSARPGDPQANVPFGFYTGVREEKGKLLGDFVVTPVGKGMKKDEALQRLRGENFCWIRVVAPHEAVPGHHLQFCVLAREQKRRMRHEMWNPSYIEGWAFYCEGMLDRNGYFDQRTRIALLKMRLWRAARTVIDMGFRCGILDKAAAMKLMIEGVGHEPLNAKLEVDRYMEQPGYYAGYLLGGTQINDLRKDLQKKMGDKFSQKDFHDRFLRFGPAPIPLIRKVMLGER